MYYYGTVLGIWPRYSGMQLCGLRYVLSVLCSPCLLLPESGPIFARKLLP
jgi:hypothetical protein